MIRDTRIVMIILGIDPGTTKIGYALLRADLAKIDIGEAGLIPIKSAEKERRLLELHGSLKDLLARVQPQALAVEKLFFAKNQKTALAVSEARGVILLTTALAGVNIFEYTPLEIKKSVTGDGGADKLQIKKMIALILRDSPIPRYQDDVFDAIAVALTHCLKAPDKFH